jgi:hypothetical protein
VAAFDLNTLTGGQMVPSSFSHVQVPAGSTSVVSLGVMNYSNPPQKPDKVQEAQRKE